MDIVFNIYKDKDSGETKIRVGNNLYTLNPTESEKLKNFLILQAQHPLEIAVPDTMRSMVIMFENGSIAMNLSMGSIGYPPKGFILMVTYSSPELIRYDTNMFFVDMATLKEYITAT
ncbi:MAG: hypothetical protein NC548_38370 [Lachnospiraceae bacterium]|nr:hypothetical protein [Lachnospiraceae bacterium]